MNKLLTTLFALAVASATGLSLAQAPAPAAPAPAVITPAAIAPAAAPAAATTAAAPAKAPATPTTAKSLEAKIAMCVGCHAIRGYHATFPEVYRVPMIAGQNAKYIAASLSAYRSGDRKHPTMRGVATSLTDQDIADISAYYEREGMEDARPVGKTANREPSAQVAALMQKAACVSCHGANFETPIDPSYPKIAGQHPDYLFVALKAYKIEGNAKTGRNNAIMAGIAKQFTNAELKALASYIGSLDGSLATKPESRFRTGGQ